MGKVAIQQMLIQLTGDAETGIQIFPVTLIFSFLLDLLMASGCMSKNQLLQVVVKVYISIMRGAPLVLQLMVVYFGPYCLFRIGADSGYRLWATFIGSVTNYAAYFAEIYGNGTQSMSVGQYKAVQILGYSRFQTFFRIILPQVTEWILPSVINEVITPVKDASLASTPSVTEMSFITKALVASQTNTTPSVVAGLFYYIFNLVVAVGTGWVEKKMDYYRQGQEDYGL